MDDERFWDIDINKHRSASMMLEFAASSVPSGHHRHTGDTSSAGLELGGVLQNSIRRKLGREELVGVGVFFFFAFASDPPPHLHPDDNWE